MALNLNILIFVHENGDIRAVEYHLRFKKIRGFFFILDGVSSRPWLGGSRRRESAGSSLSTKSEVSRKPQPHRVKPFDKRPRPRGGGGYNSGAVARNETLWVEEEQQVELGSVFLPGSKKQSLNHLLNFSYTPRERGNYQSDRGHHGNNGNRMLGTKKHKYNKEHFLQAK